MSFFLLLEKKNASQLFTKQFFCLHAFYFKTAFCFPPVSSQFIVLFVLFTYCAIYFSAAQFLSSLLCSCPCSTRLSSVYL